MARKKSPKMLKKAKLNPKKSIVTDPPTTPKISVDPKMPSPPEPDSLSRSVQPFKSSSSIKKSSGTKSSPKKLTTSLPSLKTSLDIAIPEPTPKESKSGQETKPMAPQAPKNGGKGRLSIVISGKGSRIGGSRFQLQSISKAMSQRLGKGRFSRRDGLIAFFLAIGILVYSFAASSIFIGFYWDSNDTEPAGSCDYLISFENCTNVSTTTTSITNTTSEEKLCNETTPTNETWNEWESCLSTSSNITTTPVSLGSAIIYAWTIMTTIGYGHIVAIGESAQMLMVLYSFLTNPMFFVFLEYVTESVRGQFAFIYDRLVGAPQKKKRAEGKESKCYALISKCPDLVPFTIVLVVDLIYMFTVAGICFAFEQLDTYWLAFYFLFQSVALIGFGDQLPNTYEFQLVAALFVVFGIVLLGLTQMVLEEWFARPIEKLVAYMTNERKIKPMAEQTLEDLMAFPPGDFEMSPPPLPTDQGVQSPRGRLSINRSSVAHPVSSHVRLFTVRRFGLAQQQDEDDEMDTMMLIPEI